MGLCKNFLFGSSLFLKSFLTRQFYEFSFISVLFAETARHFFQIHAPFLYFSIRLYYSTNCTCILPQYTVIYEDVILTYVCRLLFYTIHRDKDNNNNGMRHETAWLDCLIDRTFHQNGSDGKKSNSSSYGRKVRHQSHFPPPFCFISLLLLLLFIYFIAAASNGSVKQE